MALADAPPQSDSVFHRLLSKIIDVREYLDHAEALQAVGLVE